MRAFHSSRVAALTLGWTVAGLLCATSLSAQTKSSADFSIMLRGRIVGNETVTIEKTADGTTISGTGRFGPPIDIVLRSLQIRYDASDRPVSMEVDASVRGLASVAHTSTSGTTATNTLTPANGQAMTQTQPIDPAAVLLPNPFVAPYEALAWRLRTAVSGSQIPIYQPGGPAISAAVGASTPQQIQTVNGLVQARQVQLTLAAENLLPVALEVWSDEHGRLLRVSIPAQTLDFVREDLAAVSARIVTMSRPNDEDIRIPANGFSLAGTLSKPHGASGRLPAVLLVSGANQTDRDETIAGIPLFGQLANALADHGNIVVRYDKRGVGQSGGRADAATLLDFAEDAKAAVQFLRNRKDVDDKRIAIVGHSEGGWIAMLTAAGNGRVSAVALLSTVAVTGADLNLYQVAHGLERTGRNETERQSTLTLQRQIQQAVISGKGWEGVSVTPQIRRQADTPYFQSFLSLDPSTLVRRIDQPMLVVQGALDKQVPPGNAEKMEALAKARKQDRVVTVVQVPGVNHLLVSATTGEMDEYGTLPDRHIHPAVLSTLTEWVRAATTRK